MPQRRTCLVEYDRKSKIQYSVKFNHLLSVFVVLFFIFSTFGQIQSFSVEFKKLMFIVVIFWSCSNSYGSSVLVIFKPIFSHIDSVKLTSLILIAMLTYLTTFPFQVKQKSTELENLVQGNSDANFFLEEIPVGGYLGIQTKLINHLALHHPAQNYFWIACQSHQPPSPKYLSSKIIW